MTYYPKHKKINKKEYFQKLHAKIRLSERFSHIPVETIDSWEKMIRKGKANFVSRQSNRITIHEIIHEGIAIKCVYDTKRNNIVTVLPTESTD